MTSDGAERTFVADTSFETSRVGTGSPGRRARAASRTTHSRLSARHTAPLAAPEAAGGHALVPHHARAPLPPISTAPSVDAAGTMLPRTPIPTLISGAGQGLSDAKCYPILSAQQHTGLTWSPVVRGKLTKKRSGPGLLGARLRQQLTNGR